MSSKYIVLVSLGLGALVSLGACDKKETPPAEVTEQAPATATPPAPAPVAAAAAPVDLDTLPVQEEFEADAQKELTAANLNAKLDDLEKEISSP